MVQIRLARTFSFCSRFSWKASRDRPSWTYGLSLSPKSIHLSKWLLSQCKPFWHYNECCSWKRVKCLFAIKNGPLVGRVYRLWACALYPPTNCSSVSVWMSSVCSNQHDQVIEQPKNEYELARIRTWNLLIRSQTRYPLRHKPCVGHRDIFAI